jgi:diguanylate cyclase
MQRHAVTPSANNYAVWFAYHSRSHPGLRAELDRQLDAGRAIDDVTCEALYVGHFLDLELGERVAKAGGKIAHEIDGAMREIKTIGARTKAYGTQLEQARGELNAAAAADDMRRVVDTLASATHDMSHHSRDLERKLFETSKEVTTLREQLEQVRVEACTDALTGTANRKAFEARLAELSAKAESGAGPLSLILCDIDFFKRVNDTFGHLTGDQVIRFVATVMQRACPEGGMVARLGGEEFALVCPNIDQRSAMALAEKIRVTVENKRLVRRASNEDLGQITISLGVAGRSMREGTASFVERADAALYASKRSGRNKVTLAPPTTLVAAA